jgi:glycosyltransferase involved in cell wall biosynthesis
MSQSAIYVLPAVDEPFGMTVLEALACMRPVVITNTCALAAFVEEHQCGIVTDGSAQQLTDAVSLLLDNPKLRVEMGVRGASAVTRVYGMDEVSEILTTSYRSIREAGPGRLRANVRREGPFQCES